MRQFSFYEFAGIIVPGMILLVAAAVCSPSTCRTLLPERLTAGETGIALVVAYALGHLVQGIGNLLEKLWWWPWGGMPTDWLRKTSQTLLATSQIERIDIQLRHRLGLDLPGGFKTLSADAWRSVVGQVYAAVSQGNQAGRVDIFNGNYGLNRGIAAALVAAVVVALLTHTITWVSLALLIVGLVVALLRMHRFGVHYARELFVQFLTLTANSDGKHEG